MEKNMIKKTQHMFIAKSLPVPLQCYPNILSDISDIYNACLLLQFSTSAVQSIHMETQRFLCRLFPVVLQSQKNGWSYLQKYICYAFFYEKKSQHLDLYKGLPKKENIYLSICMLPKVYSLTIRFHFNLYLKH